MPTGLNRLMQQLQLRLDREEGAVTDARLLERFLSTREEEAFAVLVRRHGPMVLGVCRRILGNPHDAEDAFQATFLVAVRKAASVHPRERFGNWLYGVAYRTALEARGRINRQRAKEKQVEDLPHPEQVEPEAVWQELRPLLDQELSRLPDKYRAPVVLCDLEGRSRQEAARQLRLPEGTLSSRLATARKTLARRLSRYGPALSGAVVALVLAERAAAGVSGALLRSVIKAATLVDKGPGAVAAVTSAQVVALSEGVLQAMKLTRFKAGLFVLTVALAVAGASVTGYYALAGEPTGTPAASQPAATALEASEPKPADERRPAEKPAASADDSIRGSGKEATKEFKVSGFTTVEVGDVFQVEITQADSFRTTITADDNVLPFVNAVKEGNTLKIRLDGQNRSFQNVTLKASVAMPSLEGVTLRGASHVTLGGFKSATDFKVRASEASKLQGEIQAGDADLEAAGASHVTLKGSAKKTRLSAKEASQLALTDFALDSADVTLKGASQATIQVKKQLDYDLSGASNLRYRGDPMIGKKRVAEASSASPK
jgi:RNA polymerase sigma factor (sigma-70 family)